MLLEDGPVGSGRASSFERIGNTVPVGRARLREDCAPNGGNNEFRNNPSHHFSASAHWCAAYVALCGSVGSCAGWHSWRHSGRRLDPCPFGQDLRTTGTPQHLKR
jgi:hypothetical protein